MSHEIEKWMREWADRVNSQNQPQEDFWIETPFGIFKNPKFIPSEQEADNEITFTIKYDEWQKI